MYYSNYFFVYLIIIAILIFGISLGIDVIREKLFKKISSTYNKINKKVGKLNDLQYN